MNNVHDERAITIIFDAFRDKQITRTAFNCARRIGALMTSETTEDWLALNKAIQLGTVTLIEDGDPIGVPLTAEAAPAGNWVDTIVIQGEDFNLTERRPLHVSDGALSFYSGEAPSAYHAHCLRHDVHVEVGRYETRTITSRLEFCPHCQAGECPTPRQSDPLTLLLRKALANQLPPVFCEAIERIDFS